LYIHFAAFAERAANSSRPPPVVLHRVGRRCCCADGRARRLGRCVARGCTGVRVLCGACSRAWRLSLKARVLPRACAGGAYEHRGEYRRDGGRRDDRDRDDRRARSTSRDRSPKRSRRDSPLRGGRGRDDGYAGAAVARPVAWWRAQRRAAAACRPCAARTTNPNIRRARCRRRARCTRRRLGGPRAWAQRRRGTPRVRPGAGLPCAVRACRARALTHQARTRRTCIVRGQAR
jgi:hypothetical protein